MLKKVTTVALGLMTLALLPSMVWASSHREAPAITEDPAADNTDLYAWVTPGSHDKLHVVANWNPLQEPAGGPNFHKFSDSVRYEINITRGDSLRTKYRYEFYFRSARPKRVVPSGKNPLIGGHQFFRQLAGVEQTMTVRLVDFTTRRRSIIGRNIPVAPPNIGPRTAAVAYDAVYKNVKAYDNAFAARFIKPLSGGHGRVWAGPRDDGFYVDLGGVFDLANLRPKGQAQDGVSGFNVSTISLEIPTSKLTGTGKAPTKGISAAQTLGVWASASRRRLRIRSFRGRWRRFGFYSTWVQVSRLGLPLINEVVIGIQDKNRYNKSHPARDVRLFGAYFLNPVIVQDAEAVGIYKALKVDPTPFKTNRTDILDIITLKDPKRKLTKVGDVLRVDMGVDSGFPNGRPIPGGKAPNQEQADVTDVMMTVVLAGGKLALSDNANSNDKDFLKEMPWLPLPHRGFDQGHGKVPK